MHVGGKSLDGHDPFQLIFHEFPAVVVVSLPLGKGGYQASRHLGVDLVQFDDIAGHKGIAKAVLIVKMAGIGRKCRHHGPDVVGAFRVKGFV